MSKMELECQEFGCRLHLANIRIKELERECQFLRNCAVNEAMKTRERCAALCDEAVLDLYSYMEGCDSDEFLEYSTGARCVALIANKIRALEDK